MSLTKYQQKRSFDKTPEPTGGKTTHAGLRFVVQKHDASRLHYDFRLEMEGVLKSWAVPKGPSLNPADKRLAMMVEDHPFDYKDFEGVIPEGNYGAGTVIVWDEGTYEPMEPVKSKKEAEKLLMKELKSGSLKVVLHGKKLKGEFALVHTKGRGDNAWLLIKHRDTHASEKDVTLKEKSVISGKTIAKMEKTPGHIYGQKPVKKAAAKKKINASTKVAASVKKLTSVKDIEKPVKKKAQEVKPDLSDAVKASFPATVSPMLATLVDTPAEGEQWLYEIKWDGYRSVALCDHQAVSLVSRNNKSFSEKFYPVAEALRALDYHAVLDGEIVVLKEDGISDFGALQNWRSEADGDLVYYVFDLLWMNGSSLMDLPITRRKELLKKILPEEGIIRESESFHVSAAALLDAAGKIGLEGIIAKKADSTYQPGERGGNWLKIKVHKRHEVVIGGFTKNEDSPKAFSSLLVGVYEDQQLRYIGKVGTGFNDALQRLLIKKFKSIIRKTSPFTTTPDVNEPSRFRPNPPHAKAFWLKPELVCEVAYAELTSDGIMRHPSFQGMREDKAAKEVHPEVAKHTKEITAKERKRSSRALNLKAGDSIRKTLLNPSEETQVKTINGHSLKFTNLSKIFWPEEGYTKRDLLNYYYQVAGYILPYLKNRPQSLNRFPNGINGKSFYYKNVTATAPDWVQQFPYTTSEGEDKNFLVVEDEASILWMANMGAIEMNPWNSRVELPDRPDWCIIDIDPADNNTFEQVIQVARATKQVLDAFNIKGYPKTSGSTGIHIYIPLAAKYTYDECQMFGRLIAKQVQEALPAFTSIERMTQNRKGKIYVDFLQNRPKATLAAPYSVRPKPGATVSMPLHWEEVKKGLKIAQFTLKNALARIKSEGDLFKPVLGKGIDIAKALALLQD